MFLARTTVRCEKLKEVQPKPGQTTFHVRQVNRLNAGLLRNGFTGEVNLERSYLPGRYFVGFWHEFLHFPTTLNTIEYRIYPQELPQIYREMTKLYEDVYISELRGALQRVTNEFTIDQAWKDYATVQKKMHDICKEVLTVRHADCLSEREHVSWGLQLWGIRLQVANVTVIQQKGQADKQRIERDAVSAARSALVTAQGEVLNLVRGIVKVNATDTVPERLMTGSDLAKYQRVLMFKEKALSILAQKKAEERGRLTRRHEPCGTRVAASFDK
eukprot:g17211.t1